MDKLKEVIAFILKRYPIKSELSNARVTKIVYLADWHQAIHRNRQITPINWYFDNYGPYVQDVQNKVAEYPDIFGCESTYNIYGKPKTVFMLIDTSYTPTLGIEEVESINHVINETSKLNWDSFIKLVYSTYPIITSERHSSLDLVEKSNEYKLT